MISIAALIVVVILAGIVFYFLFEALIALLDRNLSAKVAVEKALSNLLYSLPLMFAIVLIAVLI